jgi:lipoprotein-anchoring transpeptidase ErfK/SrfK
MNKIFKIAAAAMLAAAVNASAAVADDLYGNGVIIEPASYTVETEQNNAEVAPALKHGKIVNFSSSKPRGSIIVVTKSNELFFVLGNGKAIKYRVASAKKGFEWAGTHKVSRMVKWPDWRPPTEMRKRKPELPKFMAGGPENPLGARALYLGSSIYRIHGTNEPSSIGKAASSGCIRMHNDAVSELYRLVKVGAEVTVL